MGPTLEALCPLAALSQALGRIEGQEKPDLIHHSDRPKGSGSTDQRKNELLKGTVFHNIEEVQAAVSKAVDFYNNERPHMSIDMFTFAPP